MIIFGKKRVKQTGDDSKAYFMHRDSLTGLMDKGFLFKEYERVKGDGEYSVVAVRLLGCDDMPYYKATQYIKEAGEIIARICDDNVSRIDNGDFVVLSKNARTLEKKLSFFLSEVSEDEERYAVAWDTLDKNEKFEQFIRRIKRHAYVAGIGEKAQML